MTLCTHSAENRLLLCAALMDVMRTCCLSGIPPSCPVLLSPLIRSFNAPPPKPSQKFWGDSLCLLSQPNPVPVLPHKMNALIKSNKNMTSHHACWPESKVKLQVIISSCSYQASRQMFARLWILYKPVTDGRMLQRRERRERKEGRKKEGGEWGGTQGHASEPTAMQTVCFSQSVKRKLITAFLPMWAASFLIGRPKPEFSSSYWFKPAVLRQRGQPNAAWTAREVHKQLERKAG